MKERECEEQITLKIDALNVSNRVKQLKMNHVFKIRNQTSSSYMLSNFNRLNANNNRMTTRASAIDFFVPRVSGQGANTFFYSYQRMELPVHRSQKYKL